MPIRKRRRRTFSHHQKNMSNESIATLWSYKLLVKMQLWKKLQDSYVDEAIFEFLGIAHLINDGELSVKSKQLLSAIKQNLNELEQENYQVDRVLSENIQQLMKIINLNHVEQQILEFAVILQSVKGFQDVSDELGELNLKDVYNIISFLLEIPERDVKSALNANNTLFQSGLVKIDRNGANELQRRVEIMSGLSDSLLLPNVDLNNVFERYFALASKSRLKRSDFNYLDEQVEIIERSILLSQNQVGKSDRTENKKSQAVKGMNILIYGPPGTGKSELARLIAKNIGFICHEIAMSDEDGDPINGQDRFASFRLAQQVLKRKQKNLIIFDEIEDVFPNSFMSFFGGSQNKGQKAWVNRLLETNEVPAIWISNDVWQIDDAYKRRFKFVLKMDIPPHKQRIKIIKGCVKDLPVTKQWLNCVAEHTELSPALITQSAQMVSLMNQSRAGNDVELTLTSQKAEADLNQIINNSLEVMEKEKITFSNSLTPIAYNIDVLNPDRNIKELLVGLERQKQGRICLYGPPGTGKTAFGHYVAKNLKQRLMVKRASDLLGMYVGQTEKNIANMFEQAKQDNAVLLLDEADSFLRDRKGANRSWEVTQVNELLTQMENYEGIFICSTNLIDNLDEASIRRFDLKIKLDYCMPQQVFLLFKQVLKEQGSSFSQQSLWKQKLSIFHNLTPGDFATVVRQNRLSAQKLNADSLFFGLKQESEFKSGENKQHGIGFAANF